MLAAVAITPSAPVLVPELAGLAAGELLDVRAAVFEAASALPPRWIAVGVGASEAVFGPECTGTFAGYGVDVSIGLSRAASGTPSELPLAALFAGWVRGQSQPDARVEVRVFPASLTVGDAVTRGRGLRAQIDEAAEPVGVLIVADGLATLTPPAPGGYDPDSPELQRILDDALATGDCAALTRLPGSVVGRTAFAVLAGLCEPAPRTAKELYRGVPFGVGYFAGVWQP